MQISIARTSHDIVLEGGHRIKPGLVMSGTMNIFGVETDASISLLPSEVSTCMSHQINTLVEGFINVF